MKTKSIIQIKGGFLAPLCCDDVHQKYVDGLNDPAVNKFLEVRQAIQTFKSVSDFVQMNIDSVNSILWGIWIESGGDHIGTLRIHSCDKDTHSCHIGICLFCKDSWGKGIGSKSIRAATRWAFIHLGVISVEAHCYLENQASIATFLKSGYTRVANGYKLVTGQSRPVEHAILVCRHEAL
jgi:ribosomal-protein-alanine N-acetyltransferase